jgi:hypothetical protein
MQIFPTQTEVYTSAWSVTHSEKYFSEPMAFKPERWLDSETEDVREASQPFSLGTRGCLGQKYVGSLDLLGGINVISQLRLYGDEPHPGQDALEI